MANQRDPERDQPLPKPGKVAIQPYLMAALTARAEHGLRKYGRYLESENEREALVDLWEELADALNYVTQKLVEQGVALPGVPLPEGHPAISKLQDLVEGDGPTQDAAAAWLADGRTPLPCGCPSNYRRQEYHRTSCPRQPT